MYECRCDGRLQTKRFTCLSYTFLLLLIIRVKRELERVYRNGCRYNERLNTETGRSKTPRNTAKFQVRSHHSSTAPSLLMDYMCRKARVILVGVLFDSLVSLCVYHEMYNASTAPCLTKCIMRARLPPFDSHLSL
jgi:hypothetical protein